MKTLVLTVGLPRSGKSTWARQQGHPIVCPDEIRLALHGQRFVASAEPMVWATARLMVAALFGAGHDTVILDACNTTKKRRDEWEDERWSLSIAEVTTDRDTCILRAQASGREDIIPVINRMAAQFEPIESDQFFTVRSTAVAVQLTSWKALNDPPPDPTGKVTFTEVRLFDRKLLTGGTSNG